MLKETLSQCCYWYDCPLTCVAHYASHLDFKRTLSASRHWYDCPLTCVGHDASRRDVKWTRSASRHRYERWSTSAAQILCPAHMPLSLNDVTDVSSVFAATDTISEAGPTCTAHCCWSSLEHFHFTHLL